jgi:hypothetical protein
MCKVSASGLRIAPSNERRFTVRCIHNASNDVERVLIGLWADKTPEQAHEVLAKPDVTVTNLHDKTIQLAKLLAFSAFASRVFALTRIEDQPLPSPLSEAAGVATPQADPDPDIFISLRFGEASREAEELQQQLTARGVRAFICDVAPGGNLHTVIASAMDKCKLVIILASETYGRATNNLFDTSKELAFVISENKPFFLIKMCDRWAEATTRMVLGATTMYTYWGAGEPMPDGMVDDVLSKLEAASPQALPTPEDPSMTRPTATDDSAMPLDNATAPVATRVPPTGPQQYIHLAIQPSALTVGNAAEQLQLIHQLTEL